MRFTRARRRRTAVRRASVGLVVVATLAATTLLGLAAANTVPGSKAADRSSTVTAEELKPSACSAIVLSALVTGSGVINGGNASELILGSSGADTISGNGGDDCIVAGGGNDVCIGGLGTNKFVSCETQI
jgi:Ca2+-binding RTX toxin-like protein